MGAAATLVFTAWGSCARGSSSPPTADPILLEVDVTDTARRVERVTEHIPLHGERDLTLLYPQWIPGDHGPTGQISRLAGLVVNAGGRHLEWQRDATNMFAFHIQPPAAADSLDLSFEFLTPPPSEEGAYMTADVAEIPWNAALLYPAGRSPQDVMIQPSLRVRSGWQVATALLETSRVGDMIHFDAVTLETLIDSPAIAGEHFAAIDLAAPSSDRVRINLVGPSDAAITLRPDQSEAYRALLRQALLLFGDLPFVHYDFLVMVGDGFARGGTEHRQSSENGVRSRYFTDWDGDPLDRTLLAHEFAHTWNGKYRRPKDMDVADFNTPLGNSLLWLYEGQTQYWGIVLAARAGLLTKDQAVDAIALAAAQADQRPGRLWRSLEDTTNDPIFATPASIEWPSWQRIADYYSEGLLLWLDVDTRIRDASNGKHSLDDFARQFFAPRAGVSAPIDYDFNDVVNTLGMIQPFDWSATLRDAIYRTNDEPPLRGLARAGYRLRYDATPSVLFVARETRKQITDLRPSIGISVRADGTVSEVIWSSPAFEAGLAPDDVIVGVDGHIFTQLRLKDCIAAAAATASQIKLTVRDGEALRDVTINYHDGLRYPHLVRIPGSQDRLDDILKMRRDCQTHPQRPLYMSTPGPVAKGMSSCGH